MVNKSLLLICIAGLFGVAMAMPIEMIEALESYRNACINMSGSDEGYHQVIRSLQPMQECVKNKVNLNQLTIDMATAPGGNWKEAYLSYCPKFNQTIPCFDDIVEGVSMCMGENVEQFKTIFRNVFTNLIGLLCEPELRFFTESRKPEFKACASQMQEYSIECTGSSFKSKKSPSSYTEEDCQNFKESRGCIQTKVDECGAPFLMELFDTFYNAVMQASSCEQPTKPSGETNNEINTVDS